MIDVVEDGVDLSALHHQTPEDPSPLSTLPSQELEMPLENMDEDSAAWDAVLEAIALQS